MMETRRRRVGNYALGGVLGEGSFAKVLLGTHILTGEEVSVIIRGPCWKRWNVTGCTCNLEWSNRSRGTQWRAVSTPRESATDHSLCIRTQCRLFCLENIQPFN